MAPLMVNIRENGDDSRLGDAAAYYQPDDFYLPSKWVARYPKAIAFLYVKTLPNKVTPIYEVENDAVVRVWGGDKENVRRYLTDHVETQMYIGPFVSEVSKVRLPPRRAGWRGGD